MHNVWRLLIDQPADGAANMARDEATLACHAAETRPTLRLYRWQPACLSLGRFQRADAIDWAACERAGVAIVRRPSGGRALLHDAELTYAIIARADNPLFGDPSILASYRQISLALLAGLRRLGVLAELTPVARDERRKTKDESSSIVAQLSRPDNTSPSPDERRTTKDTSSSASPIVLRPSSLHSAACFDTPAAYELTVAGRKLAGSAQTRRAGAILQHGAIPLAPHAERLSGLLRHPPADLSARMIALDQAAGRPIAFDELAEALIAGFGDAWGIRFERGALSEQEQREEQRLIAQKYTSARWTYGREDNLV